MNITDDGFIEIDITPEMIVSAQAKADEMGELKNSIRRGKGNLAGFLGEEVVLTAFAGSTSHNTYEHDIKFEEVSFEVKTKDRTVSPKAFYEASVAKYNTKQIADFYCFVSLLRVGDDYVKGFVIGIIPKEEYKKAATALKKGDYDARNRWTVSADCYNLLYSSLQNFDSWK